MMKLSVSEQQERFKEGQEYVQDDPRSGQPKLKGQMQMWTKMNLGALRLNIRHKSNGRSTEYE
jgi:hypothetical protein